MPTITVLAKDQSKPGYRRLRSDQLVSFLPTVGNRIIVSDNPRILGTTTKVLDSLVGNPVVEIAVTAYDFSQLAQVLKNPRSDGETKMWVLEDKYDEADAA